MAGDRRLGRTAAEQIGDARNTALLSAAVAWEIGITTSIGKLRLDGDPIALLLDAGARPLPITIEHAALAGRLPGHHRDPFDRMLVAQARCEGAVIVSQDAALAEYDVPVIW